MANINEDMAKEDLNSVKFLLGQTLSREKMENAQVKVKKVLFSLPILCGEKKLKYEHQLQLPPFSFDRVSLM